MVVPIKPTKIKCTQCQYVDVFSSPTDVITFFPRCKKCGGEMKMIGQMTALDWLQVGLNKIKK